MPANRSLGAVSLGNAVLRCTRGREAKPNGIKPAGGAGFAYMQGPDGAIVDTWATCRRIRVVMLANNEIVTEGRGKREISK